MAFMTAEEDVAVKLICPTAGRNIDRSIPNDVDVLTPIDIVKFLI